MPDQDTNEIIETVAEATAVCGMQQIANWLPPDRHAELKETLQDLATSAIHAYADATRGYFHLSEPSNN